MTVSSTTRKAGPFVGDDVADTFPFTFKVFADADLLVVKADSDGVETTLELTTDYTVSLNADQDNDPGGDVVTVAALATGETLVVTSAVAETQLTQLTSVGAFTPRVINQALDKQTILVQQLAEKVGRAVVMPITSSDAPPDPADVLRVSVQAAASASAASSSASAASASATAAAASASLFRVSSIAALRALEPVADGQQAFVNGAINDGAPYGGMLYQHVAANTTWPDDGERVIVTAGGKRWIAAMPYMLSRDSGYDNDGLLHAINIKPVNPHCSIGTDLQCATISGGGREDRPQRIGTFSGSLADMSLIGGGYDNINNQLAGSILGGAHHFMHAWSNGGSGAAEWDDANHGTIAGGSYAEMMYAKYAYIGGGTRLKMRVPRLRSRVSGSATRVWMEDTFTSSTPTTGPLTYTDTVTTPATEQAVVLWHDATYKPRKLAHGTDYTVDTGTKQITLTSPLLTTGYTLKVYAYPSSNDHSVIGGGGYNELSGANNVIGGGYGNTVDGVVTGLLSGKYCYAGGTYQVVCGGDSNEIRKGGNGTGSKNFLGGGGDNIIDGGTTCTGNVLSGGVGIRVYGNFHAVCGGDGHVVGDLSYSASYAAIGGGLDHVVGDCIGATIPGGREINISADYGAGWGYQCSVTANRGTAHGYKAVAKYQSGRSFADGDIAIPGDSQGHELIYKGITTSGSSVALSREGGSTTIVLDDYSSATFHILITGRNIAGNEAAGYRIVGVIRRDNGAATTTIVGTPPVTVLGEDDASWGATVAASTSGGGLIINVNGTAGKTIHWTAIVSMVAVKTA